MKNMVNWLVCCTGELVYVCDCTDCSVCVCVCVCVLCVCVVCMCCVQCSEHFIVSYVLGMLWSLSSDSN